MCRKQTSEQPIEKALVEGLDLPTIYKWRKEGVCLAVQRSSVIFIKNIIYSLIRLAKISRFAVVLLFVKYEPCAHETLKAIFVNGIVVQPVG